MKARSSSALIASVTIAVFGTTAIASSTGMPAALRRRASIPAPTQ